MRGILSSGLLRTSSRAMLRGWIATAAVGALLVVLTGCVRYELNGELHRDDTFSGTFTFALKQENVVQLYGSEQAFLDMLKTQLENSSGDGDSAGTNGIVPGRPRQGTVDLRVYRAGELVGYRQKFTGIPIAELNPTALRVRHQDSRFIVDINVDFLNTDVFKLPAPSPDTGSPSTPTPSAPKDDAALRKDLEDRLRDQGVDPAFVFGKGSPELTVRLKFPGEIISTNGEVSGRSVTWKLVLGKQKAFHASAWDSPERSLWWLYLIFLIVAAGPAFLLARLGLRHYRGWRRCRRLKPGALAPEPEKPVLGFDGLPKLGE